MLKKKHFSHTIAVLVSFLKRHAFFWEQIFCLHKYNPVSGMLVDKELIVCQCDIATSVYIKIISAEKRKQSL